MIDGDENVDEGKCNYFFFKLKIELEDKKDYLFSLVKNKFI